MYYKDKDNFFISFVFYFSFGLILVHSEVGVLLLIQSVLHQIFTNRIGDTFDF